MALGCPGCMTGSSFSEVSFEWFNLSTNQIWVTDVAGLSAPASPGRLMPSHAEDQLERAESTFSKAVHINETIKLVWKDNGNRGWPGGVDPPGSSPPGVTHTAELRRASLGIPAKLSSGKIRFTYLGNGKWRVKLVKLKEK